MIIEQSELGKTEKKTTINNKHISEKFDYVLIALGVISASIGLESFLMPSSFLDGGVTGISLIANKLTDFPLSLFIFIINLPFIILAYYTVGKKFAFKSIIGIFLLAILIQFSHYPVVTTDPLLVATFGGFFLGLGIGLAIRGGAIIDGTEVLAIYISRNSSLTVGNVILLFNIVIFIFAAYVFSVSIALYAILTYFAASKTVDFVIDGIEEFIGVTIISDKSNEIRITILNNMGRGCTIYHGRKGFSVEAGELQRTYIVYTVITRLEMTRLLHEIDKIDPSAFIIMNTVKDTRGGMLKKKPLKKIKA